jgi:hypothetical protein
MGRYFHGRGKFRVSGGSGYAPDHDQEQCR